MPLADELRPKTIDDVVGQEHVIGKNKLFNNIASNKIEYFPSLILYGPPGIGKTTISEILATSAGYKFYKLNATIHNTSDIKRVLEESKSIQNLKGTVLFVDEVHRFNKSTQQLLLNYIEKGDIKFIGSTTENPFHNIQNGIVSRCNIVELKPLTVQNIKQGIKNGINAINNNNNNNFTLEVTDDTVESIALFSNGDLRVALNTLELCTYSTFPNEENIIYIDKQRFKDLSLAKHINFDSQGDNHYDILSAFQKAIRGSDPDASLHYLARLIKGGDLTSISRRLLVIASEDVGLAYPNAISIVKACIDTAKEVGLPEARFALAQATVLLATSPKSNSIYKAVDSALSDLESFTIGDIPKHLKDSHYKGAKTLNRGNDYLYPHDYKNNYIQQQYLPDNLKDKTYYKPQNNKHESIIQAFLSFIKGKK